MAIYADAPREVGVVEWSDGVSWLVADETGRRASHAVAGEDGVWLFDPIDAPGVDDLLAGVGTVAGVAVLSNYHARDAGAFAERYGVPVSVPSWMNRVTERVDAAVSRYDSELGASGFAVRRSNAIPGLREAVAYRDRDGTLYVPDLLGSAPTFTVGDERVGVYLLARLFPPRDVFAGLRPDRLLFGHGRPIDEEATGALSNALSGARRRFPRALVTNGPTQLRALAAALG